MVRAFETWWHRLWRRTPAAPISPTATEQPQTLLGEQDVFLSQLITDLGDGKRRDEVGSPEVLAKLDGLWQSGHERLAIEWMEKLLAVPGIAAATVVPVRARVVERYEQRGELDNALGHLEVLANDETHALRAHYLLAERARRREDHELALRHYEAVLARDIAYPNVRVRVERLRQLTGRAAPKIGRAHV